MNDEKPEMNTDTNNEMNSDTDNCPHCGAKEFELPVEGYKKIETK
jgi:hypothetical protein